MIGPGDRLGSFAISAALGAGGMGAVFAATDERLQRSVAIKVLHAQDSEQARLRLVREARVAASLDHPGLVHIFELGEHEGLVYVVMELVRGRTLSELLATLGPPSVGAVAAAGEAIARATAAAHEAGIVHRDIKPRNVMLKPDGTIKVLDFGLAKPMSGDAAARITASGAINGTPLYLAPELLDAGQPSALSDVWALGITLAELATGTVPFATTSLAQLFTSIATRPADLDAVPIALRPVIARALAKSPAGRPQTMLAFALALAPLADPDALRAWANPALRNPMEGAFSRRLAAPDEPEVSPIAATASPSSGTEPSPSGPGETTVGPVNDAPTRDMAATRPVSTPPPPASAAPGTGRSAPGPRSARPLDEDALDDLAGRIASFPEPIASLAVGVEVARAEGDATGVRKRLFELGIGVVRYGTALGLAVLSSRLGAATAPKPIADTLGRAARLSDGQWCDLARKVASALKSVDGPLSKALGFTAQKPLAALVTSRNDFIHGGGSGDAALAAALGVLDGAGALLGIPLRVVHGVNPPSFEARVGTPVRAGVWRRTSGAVPPEALPGAAYVVQKDWIAVSPWLPLVDKRLLLMDSPHASGKPWRSSDPETGEHREHPPLEEAVRRLVGSDPNAPRELTDRPALVGRSPAIRALQRAAEEASQGGVRVVALTGPFGIGRTRLAQALVEAAAGFGFGRVIEAACSPERRSPLRPLRRATETATHPGLERVREAILRALTVDPVATRAAFDAGIEAIEEALVEASLEEPTVLAVDDAQWADEQTLAVLRLLTERATRKASGKLLVVVTVRDEPSPSAALRRFIGQVEQDVGSGATRMPLAPIAAEDASKLVQGVAPIDVEVERVTVEGAGGVPFFLVQPLLVWNETGALVWKDGAWRPRDATMLSATAPGVKDLVQARLGSFFDPGSEAERAAQHVLACVALYGTGLSIDRLVTATAAAGTTAVAAEHALEALVESGLLIVRGDEQEHGFAQGMVRQAVLEDLKARPWFRRIHRALLDAVAAGDDSDDAAFLATGYETLGLKAEAATWLRRAVDAALGIGSFEAAIELAERLAKGGRDPAERARAGLSVVDALLRAGRAQDARARLATTLELGVTDAQLALEARVLAQYIGAVCRDVPTDHDAALIAEADAFGDLRLRIEARIATAGIRRGRAGLEMADEAVRIAVGTTGDLRYRALVMCFERLVESEPTDHARQRRAASQALEAAQTLGSAWAALDAENNLAVVEGYAQNPLGAARLFEDIAGRAASLKFGTLHREAAYNAANCYLLGGQAEGAAAKAEAAAELARRSGHARVLTAALSLQAEALLRLRRLDAARAAIDEAIELALSRGDYTATLALLRRARIRADMGERDTAMKDAELARSLAEAGGNVDHATRATLWLAVEAARDGTAASRAALSGAVEDARKSADQLRGATLALIEEAEALLAAAPPTPP